VLAVDYGTEAVTNAMLRDYMMAHNYPLSDWNTTGAPSWASRDLAPQCWGGWAISTAPLWLGFLWD